MRQSLLYFIAAALFLVAATLNLLTYRVNLMTGFGVVMAIVMVWLGIRSRQAGK